MWGTRVGTRRPVARIFHGGGGGGAYLKNRDQIIICCAKSEDTPAECPTYGLLNLNRPTSNGTGNFYERRRCEPLGGSGADPPPKIFKFENLKTHFPALSGACCNLRNATQRNMSKLCILRIMRRLQIADYKL